MKDSKHFFTVDDVGNYYGGLNVMRDGDKFFWAIENYDGIDYEEIPRSLYIELLKHQESITLKEGK